LIIKTFVYYVSILISLISYKIGFFMISVNNNQITPCSNTSSNCVVWQGPDIPCISLCHGDTISDVIAKLAEELCVLVNATPTNIDLSGLDLLCVLPQGTEAPTTIEAILQLIIDKICSIVPGAPYSLPDVTLPACLIYTDEEGFIITSLRLDLYAAYLANKICANIASIILIQTTIDDHESRLIILENCVLPCSGTIIEVEVISSCLFPGTLVPISELLLEVERVLCNLENAVGSPALILAAVNAQCITSADTKLNGTGTYSSIPGWVTSPDTLAESNKNLWLVVCDMYAAIENIKLTCCPGACDSIIYNFTATLIKDEQDIPVSANIIFTSSSIPATYNDCVGSSNITITDKNGLSITTIFSIAALQTSPSGITIPLGALFKFDDLTVLTDFCTTDGVHTCSESITKIIPSDLICPDDLNLTGATMESLTVTFTNVLGTSAIYEIELVNVATGIVTASVVIISPGTTVSQLITGLASGTEYQARVLVSLGGSVKNCGDLGTPAITTTTPS
jgi:hypothetical protein